MIDGALPFVVGDERFLCEVGASWIAPRDVHHTFRVESETAKLVAGYTRAGMDHCFRNAGLPAANAALPPPDAPTGRSPKSKKRWRSTVTTTGPTYGPGRLEHRTPRDAPGLSIRGVGGTRRCANHGVLVAPPPVNI
jgi:hypothetical protein